jgi:hypothetical protein
MQEQAKPPRFQGCYPHILSCRRDMLPHDKFIEHTLNKCEYLTKTQDGSYEGNFPKLIIHIHDPEIAELAGKKMEKFDDIDCQDIRCTCDNKFRYEQLFSSGTCERDSILYNNCKRTIFAAAKRQMKSAPVPTLEVVEDFLSFARQKIDDLIGDDLKSFGYSYNQWYNHLTLAKQKRMDAIHEYIHGNDPLKEHFSSISDMDPKMLHYEGICKVEVQEIDGKPRMVCAIPDLIKYVMGPVCWKLEELFADKIPSYCGGKNLTQMEKQINDYIDAGFVKVAEGDGSAFDNTQDVMLKELDRYVYKLIMDKIYHVPRELFEYISQSVYKVMDIYYNEGKRRKPIMTYAVLGTVFSGDCDTTLMNTLRMGFYNWYTLERGHLDFGKDFVCFSKGDDFSVMFGLHVDEDIVRHYYKTYWLGKPKPTGPAYEGLDDRIYGLGQILKMLDFGPPNTFKFCSLRAWYKNYGTQHIFLTRNPDKLTTLSKFSRKVLHLGGAAAARYCLDQALALKVSYANINYFDAMSDMYVKRAIKFANEKLVHAPFGLSAKDRRRTLPLEAEELYDGFQRTPRRTCVKIVGSYWDTIKRYETVNETNLAPDELRVVNEQIDAEYADRPIWLLEQC